MGNQRRTIILGTAGHIDHGKTSLVKAITGIDTDTLPEEQERGITIDIGFAHWAGGITFIDVPGHERFIRNMIAGVNAVDFALVVVAADDGIMPQTREHIEILQALGIRNGAAVVTKTDLATEERTESVKQDISALMHQAQFGHVQVFTVSVKTGHGIEQLKSFLQQLPDQLYEKLNTRCFRMYVDRVFSKSGFGTVVTGTVLSGEVAQGDQLEMFPEKFPCRVRGIHKRQSSSESARTGDRAALNIAGIDQTAIRRGSVLAAAGRYDCRSAFYTHVSFGRTIKPYSALRFLTGTAELFVRLSPVYRSPWPDKEGFVIIHTSEPLPVVPGDRFILREKNAAGTVGGGIIAWPLQTSADNVPAPDRIGLLRAACGGNDQELFQWFFEKHGYIDLNMISRIMGIDARMAENMIRVMHPEKILKSSGHLIILHTESDRLKNRIIEQLKYAHSEQPSLASFRIKNFEVKYFHRTDPGLFNLCIEELASDGLIVKSALDMRLADHQIQADESETKELQRVENYLLKNTLQPPSPFEIAASLNISEKECLRRLHRLIALNKVIKTDAGIYFSATGINRAIQLTVDFIQKNKHISFQDFKRITGVSRKFALALLEYFDQKGLTEREGDFRVLTGSDK